MGVYEGDDIRGVTCIHTVHHVYYTCVMYYDVYTMYTPYPSHSRLGSIVGHPKTPILGVKVT